MSTDNKLSQPMSKYGSYKLIYIKKNSFVFYIHFSFVTYSTTLLHGPKSSTRNGLYVRSREGRCYGGVESPLTVLPHLPLKFKKIVPLTGVRSPKMQMPPLHVLEACVTRSPGRPWGQPQHRPLWTGRAVAQGQPCRSSQRRHRSCS